MFMHGTIMSAKVNDFFTVEANVFDLEEEQTYKAEIVGGLAGLEDLLALKRQAMKKGNVPDEQLEAAASQVQMPLVMQQMSIRVLRVKTNKAGFTSLICAVGQ